MNPHASFTIFGTAFGGEPVRSRFYEQPEEFKVHQHPCHTFGAGQPRLCGGDFLKIPAAAASHNARDAGKGSSAGEAAGARSYYYRPAFYNSPPPRALPIPKFFSAKGDKAPGLARPQPHYNLPAFYNSPANTAQAGEKKGTITMVEVEMEDESESMAWLKDEDYEADDEFEGDRFR